AYGLALDKTKISVESQDRDRAMSRHRHRGVTISKTDRAVARDVSAWTRCGMPEGRRPESASGYRVGTENWSSCWRAFIKADKWRRLSSGLIWPTETQTAPTSA